MSTTTTLPNHGFRQHVLTTLNHGIKREERFENLSSEIIHTVSNQLLLIDEDEKRKTFLNAWLIQIEEVKNIMRFNMMYETPVHNKQFSAALNHLSGQFKMRFSKYFV